MTPNITVYSYSTPSPTNPFMLNCAYMYLLVYFYYFIFCGFSPSANSWRHAKTWWSATQKNTLNILHAALALDASVWFHPWRRRQLSINRKYGSICCQHSFHEDQVRIKLCASAHVNIMHFCRTQLDIYFRRSKWISSTVCSIELCVIWRVINGIPCVMMARLPTDAARCDDNMTRWQSDKTALMHSNGVWTMLDNSHIFCQLLKWNTIQRIEGTTIYDIVIWSNIYYEPLHIGRVI